MTMTETGSHLAAPPGYRWRWLGLAVVLCAEVMDLLDSTITTIAAPGIAHRLGGGTTFMQWLGAAYTLAFALGLITGGRLGDLYGRRRMYLLGAVGFTAASVACGLSTGPAMLIACRAAQGAFGAILIPQGLGLLKDMFGPKDQAKAFGAFGPVMGLSAVGGPILAGVLLGADLFGTGWRSIFLINLPIGLAGILGAVLFLPSVRPTRGQRLDPVGMLLVGAGLVALLYPLVQGRELGWPWWSFALLGLGAALLTVFAAHQVARSRAGRDPLVLPALFRRRSFTGGLILGVVFFTAVMGVTLAFALYLQLGLGYSALRASLASAPNALGIVAGSIVGGAVAGRLGRRVLHLGVLVIAVGLAALAGLLATVGAGLAWWHFAPALLVLGFGLGTVFAPLFTFVLGDVAGDHAGAGAGLLNAVQQVATATGTAVLGTLFFGLAGPRPDAADWTAALRTTIPVAIALLAVTFALVFLLPRHASDQG
ncbi:putative actinorhodin transporter [Actinocatenispora thailandica]|uniref:Putative actinorhodin transporter n=1 Tax=Actinocatenispora thailandica TaxID=227318 RepID=A0A7R7DTT7_9ACTN|nr:MFS transporter [Actinocatenispora thailandica]BCJ37710.1 putative actinorhodin transporter [Actinocatenispora thailandica]